MEAVENMHLISQHSGEYEVVLTEDEKEAIQKAEQLIKITRMSQRGGFRLQKRYRKIFGAYDDPVKDE